MPPRLRKGRSILWEKRLSGRQKKSDSLFDEAVNFDAIAGYGIEAVVDSKKILLGNLRLMEEKRVELNGLSAKAEQISREGKTPMFLAVGGEAVGIIAVADTLKENSKEAVGALHRMGIKVAMMTGDNRRSGRGHRESSWNRPCACGSASR